MSGSTRTPGAGSQRGTTLRPHMFVNAVRMSTISAITSCPGAPVKATASSSETRQTTSFPTATSRYLDRCSVSPNDRRLLTALWTWVSREWRSWCRVQPPPGVLGERGEHLRLGPHPLARHLLSLQVLPHRPAVDPQMPGDRGLRPTSCIQRLRFHSRLPCEHPYGLLRRLGWSETTSVEGARLVERQEDQPRSRHQSASLHETPDPQ